MEFDYRKFRDLFHEFGDKLEEQHTYYLESLIGFEVVYERVVANQLNMKRFLEDKEIGSEAFQDTCSILYKELGNRDVAPMALKPLQKQGDVKARNKENGQNSIILGANCIVALYSYWEEYLRIEIGIAKGVLAVGASNNDKTRKILNKHVVSDIWGDLRHLRNSIVHSNGKAYSKITGCKIIKCFNPEDEIKLDYEKMRAIFHLLALYRNELNSLSIAPRKGIVLPGTRKN